MKGHSIFLRNSGDFKLTEFEIVRFDCIVPTVCMTERILFTVGSVDRSIGQNSGR